MCKCQADPHAEKAGNDVDMGDETSVRAALSGGGETEELDLASRCPDPSSPDAKRGGVLKGLKKGMRKARRFLGKVASSAKAAFNKVAVKYGIKAIYEKVSRWANKLFYQMSR